MLLGFGQSYQSSENECCEKHIHDMIWGDMSWYLDSHTNPLKMNAVNSTFMIWYEFASHGIWTVVPIPRQMNVMNNIFIICGLRVIGFGQSYQSIKNVCCE